MSNHLAVATVTAALGQLAHTAAESAVAGVDLRFGRPGAPASGEAGKKVHVYLYLVTPNAGLRNTDLPMRNSEGRLVGRARAALDLHYLLSFYGDDSLLEPDRMLGAVARDLHARPVLDAQLIRDAIASNGGLAGSDLAAAVEHVKFTPTQLSLEEMSRLWSVMIQTPHALSMAWIGTVVLIDALESGPVPQAVLRRGEEDRGVETRLGPFPGLQSYWSGPETAATRVPLLPSFPTAQLGARLMVNGTDLGGDKLSLKFVHASNLEQTVSVPPEDRNAEQLRLTLPDDATAQDAWAAGSYTVQALFDGTKKQSDKLRLVLAPRVTALQLSAGATAGATVTLKATCRPKLRKEQSAILLLPNGPVAAEPLANPSDTLTFVIEHAPKIDNELVYVSVDGVSSSPYRYDAAVGRYVYDDAQRITIP
jgi:hypothetical protein